MPGYLVRKQCEVRLRINCNIDSLALRPLHVCVGHMYGAQTEEGRQGRNWGQVDSFVHEETGDRLILSFMMLSSRFVSPKPSLNRSELVTVSFPWLQLRLQSVDLDVF